MLENVPTLFDLGPYQLIGVAGFLAYIAAVSAVQLGGLNGHSTLYSLTNILAATLVGICLIKEFNLASALIQVSWILIGFAGLMLLAWKAWPSTQRVLNATHEKEVA